jgi:hypothetical protein
MDGDYSQSIDLNMGLDSMFHFTENEQYDHQPVCRFCGPGCRCPPGMCKCEALGKCVCGAGNNRLGFDVSLLQTTEATDLCF